MSKYNVYLCADQRLYSEYLPNLPHSHFKKEKGCRVNLWYSGVKKNLDSAILSQGILQQSLVVRRLQDTNDVGNDKFSVRESDLHT